MILFEHSQGFVIAFGFDMMVRKPDAKKICWSDPQTGEWATLPTNQAGYFLCPFDVEPEFVRECDGKVIAYQPGKCIEMQFVGTPYVWSVRTLTPSQSQALRAA